MNRQQQEHMKKLWKVCFIYSFTETGFIEKFDGYREKGSPGSL